MIKKIFLLYKESQNRILILNILGTFGIKGVAMFLTLFTMPSYIRYFQDNNVLGVWFSIVSILNWILMFDLGIGNGLRNHLVVALNRKDNSTIKRLISSAYFILGIIALLIAVIGIFLINLFDWNSIFNIGINLIRKEILVCSVSIVFLGIILQFFLRIISSIYYAMQKTALPNFLALVTSALILLFINVYKNSSVENKLLALSIAQICAVCIPLLVASIITFSTSLKNAKPSIRYVDYTSGKKVVCLGGQFFLIQICLMIISSTNEILIGKFSNPADTVSYQAYNRIFSIVTIAFSLLTQPMWSAFSQANAKGNYSWMKNIYNKLQKASCLGMLGSIFLVIIFEPLVTFWLGAGNVEITFKFAIYFAILVSINLFINSSTCIANGMNELRCQMVWGIIGALCKIPLAYILVKILDEWTGVVLANIIVLLPLLIFQTCDSKRKLQDKMVTN